MTPKILKKDLRIIFITGLIILTGISFYNKLINIVVFRSHFLYDHENGNEIILIDDSEVHESGGMISLAKHTMSTELYQNIEKSTILYLTYQTLSIGFGVMFLVTLGILIKRSRKRTEQ